MSSLKRILFTFFLIPLLSFHLPDKHSVAIVIHGGAGTVLKEYISPEQEKAYRQKLDEALNAGYKILANGGNSVDAVEAAICIMEDSPLFNAGKGSVFNSEGKNEMDAAIMDGKNKMAGSVAGVTTVKNPIRAAKLVMQKSPHVMMAGLGADEFAKKEGIEIVDPSYFFDQRRYDEWKSIKEAELLKSGSGSTMKPNKYGTVGAVALDENGNLAAGTSTGGMVNKKYGRIGDAPIIGAGTYADNKTCGVSCTGHGEYFIRLTIARDVAAMMEYKNYSLKKAGDEVMNKKLASLGAPGGFIAMDTKGNIIMPFNTPGMFRGYINMKGEKEILMYK